jgi:hypothetical protein
MSANIIKKITEVFNKKDDYEATGIRAPHPYYVLEESLAVVHTQPRLKCCCDSPMPSKTGEANAENTIVAQLHTVPERLKWRWILRVIAGVDQGRQYLAVTPEIRIGRKPENHICLKDPKVSRYHALLRVADTGIHIIDLNSTNGTSVNDQKIVKEQQLASGDRIRVGETLIEINAEPW